jgi:cytoskeletal protein CcmA (bactofilin family)
MASTYSTSLKLELIGDGEQSGIWGQTTNNNLGTLLEQAITGVVSITMTNANYTLSNLNGVSDESRNAVLVVGGTNAAVRDIIAPLVEKLYWVKNSTVGGFGVRIIGSSGTGVTVPSGGVIPVYCDGTNFYTLEVTSTVGNFTVNGNLSVTGNTNAAAATYTGNVAALNISTANVAATGTGAFSGNVSALNISTANVTATGSGAFTGNVSANNVTITTTLTGNNANLSGTVRMTSTGAVLVPAGTTGQRPTAATGLFRFNSSLIRFEGYNGASWGTLGGATGGGNDQIFYENGQNVTTDYTIASTKNAMSAGPITIDSGATVTVDTGASWVIV